MSIIVFDDLLFVVQCRVYASESGIIPIPKDFWKYILTCPNSIDICSAYKFLVSKFFIFCIDAGPLYEPFVL